MAEQSLLDRLDRLVGILIDRFDDGFTTVYNLFIRLLKVLLLLAVPGSFVALFIYSGGQVIAVWAWFVGLVFAVVCLLWPFKLLGMAREDGGESWWRAMRKKPSDYLPIGAGTLVFAGLMLAAVGAIGLPGLVRYVGPLLCAPGYEHVGGEASTRFFDMPGAVSMTSVKVKCSGALGSFEPNTFFYGVAFVGVYVAAASLLLIVELLLGALVLRGRHFHLRRVLTPLVFAGVLVALHLYPAPLRPVAAVLNVVLDSKNHSTYLHRAVSSGDLDLLRERLAAGDDVDRTNSVGGTPLMWAFLTGHPDTAAMLVEHGADLGVSDKDGMQPLHYAAQTSGNLTRLMLEHGAEVSATTHKGRTPLHFAALGVRPDAAEKLLAAGAAVNAADDEGNTPLHDVLLGDLGRRVDWTLDMIRLLAEGGADLDLKNAEDWSVRDLAASLHDARTRLVVEEVLGMRRDPREVVAELGYPFSAEGLWKAAERGDRDALELFVAAGMDLNARQPGNGKTALERALAECELDGSWNARRAARSEGQQIVRSLSALGAKRNAREGARIERCLARDDTR